LVADQAPGPSSGGQIRKRASRRCCRVRQSSSSQHSSEASSQALISASRSQLRRVLSRPQQTTSPALKRTTYDQYRGWRRMASSSAPVHRIRRKFRDPPLAVTRKNTMPPPPFTHRGGRGVGTHSCRGAVSRARQFHCTRRKFRDAPLAVTTNQSSAPGSPLMGGGGVGGSP
jgi:hypothetical protein